MVNLKDSQKNVVNTTQSNAETRKLKYLEERKVLEEAERKSDDKNEVWNILVPGNKAVSFTITMSIKDWHKTLIGRLSHHGVESDMIEVLKEIASQLKILYPLFFNTIPEYFEMGNQDKYEF